MDGNEQIERFKVFIDSNYRRDLYDSVNKGNKSLTVDFQDLVTYDPELADALLENPEEVIRAAELALEQFDLGEEIKNIRVRFRNFPDSQKIKISSIRSEHLGMFLVVDGIVRQASDVRPQVTSAKFECAGCGNTISILQIDTKFREPKKCTCGWRGRFNLLSKDLIDVQHLKIEESPDSLEGGEQPKRLSVFLKEDLVDPKMEKKTSPGSRVLIYGVVKETPIQLKSGIQSIRYDLVLEANYLEPAQEDFSEISLTDEDEKEIKEIANSPYVHETFAKSIAPSIYGHEKIKEALTLQLFGGLRKQKPDGTITRGDLHILLVGDPGSGKSQILQFISKTAPKARFASGKGASGAGLCIAPDSLISTNPGGIHAIQDLVENELENNCSLYKQNVWCAKENKNNKKVFTFGEDFKIKPKEIDQFWRIAPPEYMVKLLTSSGKDIITTPNTKLFSINEGVPIWREADGIEIGQYLAGCNNFALDNNNKILFISLIKSNPIVYGVKSDVKKIISILCKNKNLNVRQLAKELKINENKLYHHWVNNNARGNICFNDLFNLINLSDYDLETVANNITFLSLRRGKLIKIPVYVDRDLLYLAGLIAGDGDIDKKGAIRLSNESEELQDRFKAIINNLFNLRCNLSSNKSSKRTESWRFSSKIVSDVLLQLGVPPSPKSHKIDMSNVLLSFPNNLLKHFLSGYFDTDGGPVERKRGSNCIEVGTTSKVFSKKLQLVLIRFGIQSRYRVKKPNITVRKDGWIINGKYDKHILTIYGKKNFELFRDRIGFNISRKREKLDRIINSISVYDTNVNVVPGANYLIKKIVNKYNLTSEEVFGYKTGNYFSSKFNISINNLKKIVIKLNSLIGANDLNLQSLNLLANSDLVWEKVVKKENIYDHGYGYVYDLTVQDSHNFIVNGLVVHNTASVVKDEFLRGWALEAGALVLANKGVAIIDELDKIDKEDTAALHSAMEQQIIPISKANVQATLNSQTTILAAANPKFGRFDPYSPIASQIDLPSTLLNRFDLIFPVRDIPNLDKDTKIALHVLEDKEETYKTDITPKFLKKYIAYVKTKIKPKLSKEAIREIKDFYVSLRNSGKEEGGIKPIPISARQLEGLIRLTEASARLRLSNEADAGDAKKAIELMKYCLMQVGFDPETGQIDIDRMSGGITASARGKIIAIKEIIIQLENKGIKHIPLGDIIAEAAAKGIEESNVEEAIDQLKKSGDIFEPRKGHISRIG